jgi:hypothetical protein
MGTSSSSSDPRGWECAWLGCHEWDCGWEIEGECKLGIFSYVGVGGIGRVFYCRQNRLVEELTEELVRTSLTRRCRDLGLFR